MTSQTTRAARLAEIRDAALVRRLCGQGVLHRRIDGKHVVLADGRIIEADDLETAIRLVLHREGTPQE